LKILAVGLSVYRIAIEIEAEIILPETCVLSNKFRNQRMQFYLIVVSEGGLRQ